MNTHVHPMFRDMLSAFAVTQISAPQDDWAVVRRVFDSGRACEGCDRHCDTSQSHPYQQGRAFERSHECTLGEFVDDQPSDCPGFAGACE